MSPCTSPGNFKNSLMSPPAAALSWNCWKAKSCRVSWPWRIGPRNIPMSSKLIPLIAGNWKMHKTLAEGRALAREVLQGLAGDLKVEVVLSPPFTALAAVAQELENSPV